MGKLVPNYKTNKFDFVDDKGQRTPSVGNLLSPVEIVKFLDVDAKTLITLETIESGKPRQFTMEANTLSRQESFGSTLFNNSYFINFKLINPLRQYVTLGIQHLQTSGKVKYKHKSLGFFTQEDDTSVFLLSKTMTLHGSSTYYDEKFQFISGTFKDYELFLKSEILPHVETQLALTIGLSSVVASYLKDFADVQTIVTNFCGASSTGKTTVAQFIASLWANPQISNSSLVKTFNSTHVARFARIEGFNGVPILLDDATTASYLNRTDLIYQLAQGESRDRSTNYGQSVAQGLKWSGLALITSETPILSDTETKLGLMARVLDFESICWTQDGAHAKRIKNAIFHDYGFIGPIFVKGFMKISDFELQELFRACQNEIEVAIPIKDELSNRIINKLAIIYMTSKLINKILGYELDFESIKSVLVEMDQTDVADRHIGLKAFEVIKNHITQHHSNFNKFDKDGTQHDSSKSKLIGIMEFSEESVMVTILSSAVQEILKSKYIYEYKTILKYWAKNNMILPQSGKNVVNVKALDSRAVRFLFNRTEDTILPWYYPLKMYKSTTIEEEPPVSTLDFNKDVDVNDIFEDEHNES